MLGAALALVGGAASAQTMTPGQPPELTPPAQTTPLPPAQPAPLPSPGHGAPSAMSPEVGNVLGTEDRDEERGERPRSDRFGGWHDRMEGGGMADRYRRMHRMHRAMMMDREGRDDGRDFGEGGERDDGNRGAEFSFDRGDHGSITIRCAERDSTNDCAEAVAPLIELLLTHPGTGTSGAPQSSPAP